MLKERIFALLHEVPREPGTSLPPGAADDNIATFEQTTGLSLPMELRAWLKICNGPLVGPGGFYGVSPAIEFLRIDLKWELYPEWKTRHWFPIAGDGCGDYYLLDGNNEHDGFHPIYFIDHEIDLLTPNYLVASNIWTFLFCILQQEADLTNAKSLRWPFDKAYVLSIDPELGKLKLAPLPWEV